MHIQNLAIIGFDDVGQALVHLLLQKRRLLESQYDTEIFVTGIFSGQHGTAINPSGIDLEKVLEITDTGSSIDIFSIQPIPHNEIDFIRSCQADVLLDSTFPDKKTGQPAINLLSAALHLNMHAITSNASVLALGYDQLLSTANADKKKFLYRAALMEAQPFITHYSDIFLDAKLLSFRGILNSYSNLPLTQIEKGASLEQAIKYSGMSVSDSSKDLSGWDAACKVAALIKILMQIPFTPEMVEHQGFKDISTEMLEQAKQQGKKAKFICSAQRESESAKAKIMFEFVSPDSPFYSVNGTSSYLQFQTDGIDGLGLVEFDLSPETTAYGLLADFISTIQ